MATRIFPVTMPKWGIEMTEGTINEWRAREGQRVEKGEALLEVETEKIVNAVESPASGVLRRIVAERGQTRAVGSLIAVLADSEVADPEVDAYIASFKGSIVSFEPDAAGANESSQAPVAASQRTEPSSNAEGFPSGEEARVSPIARRLAEKLGVDLSQVKGTGRNGRISKEDVEAYVARQNSTGAPPSQRSVPENPSQRIRMSAMRSTIAWRLLESTQSIPHYRLEIDVEADDLLRCKRLEVERSGSRITVNDLLIRACALALVRHPMLNAQLDGDEIVQYAHADVAFAVAVESGLITPIVRRADELSAAEIARVTAELTDRAQRGALAREDISGGTFTLSNLGMFGITRFDAIINPPQTAILAVGAARERIILRDAAPTATRVMSLTLSADHRVVDGATGAAFLATLKDLIEKPESLLPG